MQYHKTTIGILANAANSKFHYDQYFSMLPTGPEPQKAILLRFLRTRGRAAFWANSASAATMARVFGRGLAARQSIKQVGGFEIASEQKYPPPPTDYRTGHAGDQGA
jgi:branched-chain amino acid transport system substrate-binding protein